MSGALIVTAELGGEDQSWLDRMRRAHFPPERNQLAAHLTMFHAIPPSAEHELRQRLSQASKAPRPKALIAGLMNLGGGVAYRVVSDPLDAIRDELAAGLAGLLSAQDSGGWRPHVTIQNKVPEKQSKVLMSALDAEFNPRPLVITGLGLHEYLGGPWERLAIFPFRGA